MPSARKIDYVSDSVYHRAHTMELKDFQILVIPHRQQKVSVLKVKVVAKIPVNHISKHLMVVDMIFKQSVSLCSREATPESLKFKPDSLLHPMRVMFP